MLPSYLLISPLELRERSMKLNSMLNECRLCPRECACDRTRGQIGVCKSTDKIFIDGYCAHTGEEPPISGFLGSGTIFFSGCNLKCCYCQNYVISHLRCGFEVSPEELAAIMINLQNKGCHNINFVTPTHFIPQIVESVISAIDRGLQVPLVYNCGGFESVETLRLLENIIDVYMPDIKYSDDTFAVKYSGAKNYWHHVKSSVKEMYRQKGDLKINKRGIAEQGLLVRHLILPADISGSEKVIDFIVDEISSDTYLNLMDQYYPAYNAFRYPELSSRIIRDEYDKIIEYASIRGIKAVTF